MNETLSSNQENWCKFLDTAARFNKYNFFEQVFIYAQRPDAKACASIELWNKSLNCYVKRGSKGILLFNDEKNTFRYVFDISDVKPSKNSKLPHLWKFENEYTHDVINALSEEFHIDSTLQDDFPRFIKKITDQIVVERYHENFTILNNDDLLSDSMKNLSHNEIESMYKELVSSSMAYSILSRCDIPKENYMNILDFHNINYFDNLDLISLVGDAASKFSEPAFNVISKECTKLNNERSNDNEYNIQTRRGLSNSEHINENTRSRSDREIWENETDVSKGREVSSLFSNVHEGNTISTPSRNSESSRDNVGTVDRGNESLRERNRGIEDERSTSLGSEDEQHQTKSRRNSHQGDYSQLSLFDSFNALDSSSSLTDESNVVPILLENKEEKYTYLYPKETKECPKEYIDKMVLRGSGFENGKLRIMHAYKSGLSTEERRKFLKNEYGIGGVGIPLEGNGYHGHDHDSKGISIRWRDSEGENITKLNWTQVEKYINSHITKGDYLSEKEKVAYQEKYHSESKRNRAVDEYYSQDSNLVFFNEKNEQYYKVCESYDGFVFNIYDKELNLLDGNIYEDTTQFQSLRDFAFTNFNFRKEFIKEINFDTFIQQITEKESAVFDAQKSENGTIDSAVENENEPLQEQSNETINSTVELNESNPSQEQAATTNFHIENIQLGNGTLKEKFRNNIEAIKTLVRIENENRKATFEEQKILSNYVGWGGLSQAFDENNEKWSAEYTELKEILSSDEYVSARSSTLNAHYTSPVIIKSIYDFLDRSGFKSGKILEPAMGVGNFFGMIPKNMESSSLYGVELDSISGRIAKQLYPGANIEIKGYENTTFKDNFFDVAIGNVPFGSYKINDNEFKENFLIHDYFFAKTLNKVRPGGLIAFITSKGTLDKQNSAIRKYLSERAEFIGAIRLPNNAFTSNAGTEVTSDIIFLKKRERAIVCDETWTNLGTDSNDISMNQYFIEHPEMILGQMEMVSGPYGMESTCTPLDKPLDTLLKVAIENLQPGIYEQAKKKEKEVELPNTIPADPNVRNYSYTIIDNQLFYREGNEMTKVDKNPSYINRVKGLIEIRDLTRKIIDNQLSNGTNEELSELQLKLNESYDKFNKKFGLINSSTNMSAFKKDSSYYLICSLEHIGEDGELVGKADIFTKRTIRAEQQNYSVDTPNEALVISVNEKGCIDFDYMKSIINHDISEEEIIKQLEGVIFLNPANERYETYDEYLSGNVRNKLNIAKDAAEKNPIYQVNVEKLLQVQPKKLEAAEIDVRLGATWIEPKYINEFICDFLKPPSYLIKTGTIEVNYSNVRGVWNVSGKSSNSNNVLANVNYGTSRASAYKLIEDALNLKDTKIYDVTIEDGKEVRVLNVKETMLAQQKQGLIKEAFKDWIFKDIERRNTLCEKYNQMFNSIRPREYNGEHLTFPGMNAEINLKPNQKNAVARGIYGGNSLYAHAVGAGKTFAMAATCMKCKQLGLSKKALFVVPKSLVGQWANEFLLLYPGANLLVASAKDFEPANRKKFCSRIATGNYDAVIISHSQFDKIPLSKERQAKYIREQIDEITLALQSNTEKGFTVKQMELTRKSLQAQLEKLNSAVAKDNVVNFEELGIDRLFVDEAHNYKNLYLYTKMNNVAGISQTSSEKSSDMFNKCKYLNEITGNKGVIFATGTPVSNSMAELYTMMRYLQYDTLKEMNLTHFDSWASTFGETVTALELAVEGNSYRAKTRFSRFYNVPELMNTFKEIADIQTSDMLNLPVPEAIRITDVQKPSEEQKEILKAISERADLVRNGAVDPSVDNMLKITNDGRKLALDQRLINPLLEDNPNSKVNACVKNVLQIWNDTKEANLTQMIFCDLSTPNKNTFNVYDDIKEKLIKQGVPEQEIAFIHDADTEAKKDVLFKKVRQGNVRVLLGSTQKLGTGTNVQTKLCAVHHLDPPWRPSDIEQREGRIIRQGNENKQVKIYRYATEGTFDAYSWQMLENKQKFISQVMTSKSPVRSCNDLDDAVLNYAEVKALATGNPLIKEKMDLDMEVSKLKLLKANFVSQKYRLENDVYQTIPSQIKEMESKLQLINKDVEHIKAYKDDNFEIVLKDVTYNDRKDAGEKLLELCRDAKTENANFIGTYKGFSLGIKYDSFFNTFELNINKNYSYALEIGMDPAGNMIRLNNAMGNIEKQSEKTSELLEEKRNQLEVSKSELEKEFPYEKELMEKSCRLTELNHLLSTENDSKEFKPSEEEIKLDIKKNHMKPTHTLIDNMKKLSQLYGKNMCIKEVKEIFMKKEKIGQDKEELVHKIFKECRQQESVHIR